MTARTEFVELIGKRPSKTIPADEVLVLRADSKYVMAMHSGGELLIDEPLGSLEDEFSGVFIRTHRAYLVRRDSLGAPVKADDGRYSHIRVHGLADPVPLSRRNSLAIRKLISER